MMNYEGPDDSKLNKTIGFIFLFFSLVFLLSGQTVDYRNNNSLITPTISDAP